MTEPYCSIVPLDAGSWDASAERAERGREASPRARTTCVVDRRHPGQGVTRAALHGAPDPIAGREVGPT